MPRHRTSCENPKQIMTTNTLHLSQQNHGLALRTVLEPIRSSGQEVALANLLVYLLGCLWVIGKFLVDRERRDLLLRFTTSSALDAGCTERPKS